MSIIETNLKCRSKKNTPKASKPGKSPFEENPSSFGRICAYSFRILDSACFIRTAIVNLKKRHHCQLLLLL